jgi:hypothetical protein
MTDLKWAARRLVPAWCPSPATLIVFAGVDPATSRPSPHLLGLSFAGYAHAQHAPDLTNQGLLCGRARWGV